MLIPLPDAYELRQRFISRWRFWSEWVMIGVMLASLWLFVKYMIS